MTAACESREAEGTSKPFPARGSFSSPRVSLEREPPEGSMTTGDALSPLQSQLHASRPNSAFGDLTSGLEMGHGGICIIEIDKHYKPGLFWPGEPAVTRLPSHHWPTVPWAQPSACRPLS